MREKPVSLYRFRTQAIIISLLSLTFYFNTFFNENALDDLLVIVQNEYVQEGFSGIPDIMTKDCYDSYFRHVGQRVPLSAARYRPLSIATFAIEQQFMGAVAPDNIDSFFKQNICFKTSGAEHDAFLQQMHIRHVVNVLLYTLTCVVLLYFLRYVVFKHQPVVAFVSCIIFTIHPIHTEVVANIKSRDEILSLLFILTTFIFEFKYLEHKKKWMLGAALIGYFMAFLSKEYAVALIILLPLSLYIFNKYTVKKCLVSFMPFLGVIFLYLFVRFQVVHLVGDSEATNIGNDPYLLASAGQAVASRIANLLYYIRLLIFPHPLSADYSYNTIPYADFSSLAVWLSLLLHIAMIITMIVLVIKRHLLGFAIAFYLFFLALVSNIFLNIGVSIGERLIFHSSVGFAIVLGYAICTIPGKIKIPVPSHAVILTLVLSLIAISGFKTITRNADWKNDFTLFTTDIKTVPKSILVCNNAAYAYILKTNEDISDADKRQYLLNAVSLLDYCLSVEHDHYTAFMLRGAAWEKLGDIDKAKANTDSAKQINPSIPTLSGIYTEISDQYMQRGWEQYGKRGDYAGEIAEYLKGINIDSTNADKWYNLGGAYFHNKQYPEALNAWQHCVKINPSHQRGQRGIQSVTNILNSLNLRK